MTASGRGHPETFVLLDDARHAGRRSRLYAGSHRVVRAQAGDPLETVLERIATVERALREGAHIAWFGSYELGTVLQRTPSQALAANVAAPLFVALLFDNHQPMDAGEVAGWLRGRAESIAASVAESCADRGSPTDSGFKADPRAEQAATPAPAGILAPRFDTDAPAFGEAIRRIREWCAAGETYQVNYTCRVLFDTYGSPVQLYRRLRERQPVPYGALAHLANEQAWRWVLSCSPELFVARSGMRLSAKPMKGTAPVTGSPAGDAAAARELAADPKNRAENLMIVDLLRNDLGRIAHPGSVRVPELFAVAPHGQVLQMTSTVEALAVPGLRLTGLLQAIYPCGSITGAPKHRTMTLIDALETSARGLYTGALGWIDPPQAGSGETLGDLMLNVPIRTAVLDHAGRGVLGVGAGITHDSNAAAEYEETLLKARFLTGLPPSTGIFETMRVERGAILRRDAHLARMRRSAAELGLSLDEARLQEALDGALAGIAPGAAAEVGAPAVQRMRVTLHEDGRIDVVRAPLAPLTGAQKVCIAARRLPRGDALRRHKTTWRPHYDAAWQAAEALGCFDALFLDEDGVLIEGGRSSVFLLIDGVWLTPSIDCGVLPGVLRAEMLGRPGCREAGRPLTRDDLVRADGIALTNALRGWMPVSLDGREVGG